MAENDNACCIYDRWSPRPLTRKKRAAGLTKEQIIEEMDRESTFRRDLCQQYCEFRKLEIVATLTDKFTSGRKIPLSNREAGQQLLELIDSGRVKHVVVYSLVRLFRDNIDGQITLKRWCKKGIVMHLAAEGGQTLNSATAIGRFLIRQLLSIAELEPDQTAERTSHGMRARQSAGQIMSRFAPYGFDAGAEGVLVPNAEQQRVVKRIVRLSEKLSNREIARRLNADQVPSATGRQWHHFIVGRVIRAAKESAAVQAAT